MYNRRGRQAHSLVWVRSGLAPSHLKQAECVGRVGRLSDGGGRTWQPFLSLSRVGTVRYFRETWLWCIPAVVAYVVCTVQYVSRKSTQQHATESPKMASAPILRLPLVLAPTQVPWAAGQE